MKCRVCGKEIAEGALYCGNCGTPVVPQTSVGNEGTSPYSYGKKRINSTPYMVFAIISTILFCPPLGIAAIVFASKINKLQNAGDYEGAKSAAKKSKICATIATALALTLVLAIIVLAVVGLKESEERTTVAVSEALPDEWQSYTVQINDTVLSFPCEISELEALGFAVNTDDLVASTLSAGEIEWINFEDTSENIIDISVRNLAEETLSIEECMAVGIGVYEENVEKGGLSVIFPGGVRLGMTRKEVVDIVHDVYDEPDALITYGDYRAGSLVNGYCIGFDGGEKHLVDRMSMWCYY